jgi:outer membrane protein OmpA-like peptidoglycan-associated protein
VDYSNYERLATIAQMLKTNSNLKLRVIGNADKSGSESYNVEISKRRAQSVVDHLAKIYGTNANRFVIEAAGSKNPLADGQLQINRRVDFEVVK